MSTLLAEWRIQLNITSRSCNFFLQKHSHFQEFSISLKDDAVGNIVVLVSLSYFIVTDTERQRLSGLNLLVQRISREK